jgi:hypothetical protein
VTFVTVVFSRVPFLQKEEQIGLVGERHAVKVVVAVNEIVLHLVGTHLDVDDESGSTR